MKTSSIQSPARRNRVIPEGIPHKEVGCAKRREAHVSTTINLHAPAALRNAVSAIFVLLVATLSLPAAEYYVDPAVGSMSNDGSFNSPWSTLADVFIAGKTFTAGDTIYLRTGNHGHPQITANNSGDVLITKQAGHDPVVNRIHFNGADHWVLDNVKIFTSSAPPESPVLEHPVFPKLNNSLVRITSASSEITLSNCDIYSIANASSWSANDWNFKAWNGIYINTNCHHITLDGCDVKNINFGIHTNGSAHHVTIRNTIVQNFCGDGLRANTDNLLIEYNIIRDAYNTNGNHDDLIQGFASENVVIRGNILVDTSSSGRSFISNCQAIGAFDGWFDDWIVENNLVANGHWHGITLLGARNCRVVNNTVAKGPFATSSATPWIQIGNHKNGSASSGNYCRNNLTSSLSTMAGTTVSNNIQSTNYSAHFVDYSGLDFHLKSTSSAIDAGTTSQAPTIDLDQNLRATPYDVGCFEFGAEPPDPGTNPEIVGVTASSHDGNVPENTLDGNFGTRWSAEGSGEWIEYELSDVLPVVGMRIAFYNGDQRVAYFDIEVSTNGTNWTQVFSGQSSGTTTGFEDFIFDPEDALYVRYVGDGNSVNAWNSLTEVELIAEIEEPPPEPFTYINDFDNTTGSDSAFDTVGWGYVYNDSGNAYQGDASEANNLKAVISNANGVAGDPGYIFLSSGQGWRFFQEEVLVHSVQFTAVDYDDITSLSFYLNNSSSQDQVKAALKIDGAWYVTNTSYSASSGWTAFALDPFVDTTWSTLTVNPGVAPLAIGSSAALPDTGTLEAVGLYVSGPVPLTDRVRIDAILLEGFE